MSSKAEMINDLRLENQSLRERIKVQNDAVVAYYKEITELKQKLGGYKTSNKNYKNANEHLRKQILEIESLLQKEIEKNEDYDKKNSDQINQFYREKEQMRSRITELETLNKDLKDIVADVSKEFKEYKERPWYKKIFAK